MIERRFLANDGTRSLARFSRCGAYRYTLTREWSAGPRLNVVMLNPSTADECRNDPTVARCEARARAWGFGRLCVTNLFAFRATHPGHLKRADEAIGPCNDAMLGEAARGADMILCGWGMHGTYRGRGREVEARLRAISGRLCHLGLTKDGAPRHPLYIGYSVAPIAWR